MKRSALILIFVQLSYFCMAQFSTETAVPNILKGANSSSASHWTIYGGAGYQFEGHKQELGVDYSFKDRYWLKLFGGVDREFAYRGERNIGAGISGGVVVWDNIRVGLGFYSRFGDVISALTSPDYLISHNVSCTSNYLPEWNVEAGYVFHALKSNKLMLEPYARLGYARGKKIVLTLPGGEEFLCSEPVSRFVPHLGIRCGWAF